MGARTSAATAQHHFQARLEEARARTDEVFRIVRPEALYGRPIPERHRIIFYLGHLEAFDWNLLSQHLLGIKSFHREFDRLFAFGIDPVGRGLPADQACDWPSVEEIEQYNRRVRETLDENLFGRSTAHRDQLRADSELLLQVAIEHRLMHAETLAYMLHQLPLDQKFGHPIPPTLSPSAPPLHMVEIPAGTATLGLPRMADGPFGWDNEFEEHRVEVPPFAIDAFPVTNGEFLKFVLDGGYEDRGLWEEARWEWKESRGISHPLFWVRRAEAWFYRTMFAELPLPLDWPVYVSHAEASAYAHWAGKELPSEAEWHRAAYGTPGGSERPYPWGHQPPGPRFGNFDFRRWDPTPVEAFPEGTSAFGGADLLGNGWEWTRTALGPFPGFEPFPFYPGYSADFFDGKHYVMKGGASRTAACLLRRSFRNWFQPEYPYIYATFRCVRH